MGIGGVSLSKNWRLYTKLRLPPAERMLEHLSWPQGEQGKVQAANKVGQTRKDPKIEVINGMGMVWCCVWGKVFVSVTTIGWITH